MQKPVEKYLAEVEKQLSSLPAELRASELRELRLHIEQLIETFMADGQSQEEATNAALLQFGQAKQLCQGLKQAYKKPQRLWLQLLLAFFAVNLAEICIFGTFVSVREYVIESGSSWAYIWGNNYLFHAVIGLSGFVGGWGAEFIAPRRAIWSITFHFGWRIAVVFAEILNGHYYTALVFVGILMSGYFGTLLRQWQANKKQLAIVC